MYKVNLLVETAESERFKKLAGRNQNGALAVLLDPIVILGLAATIASVAFVVNKDRAASRHYDTLLEEVRAGLRDSTDLHEGIYVATKYQQSRQRVDDIASLLQSLDQGRYTWAHLFDQFAAAIIPDQIWLVKWQELPLSGANASGSSQDMVRFQIEGMAVSNNAVAKFMEALEASPFIASVIFKGTSAEKVENTDVVRFVLEAQTEQPDPTLLELEVITPNSRTRSVSGSLSSADALLLPESLDIDVPIP